MQFFFILGRVAEPDPIIFFTFYFLLNIRYIFLYNWYINSVLYIWPKNTESNVQFYIESDSDLDVQTGSEFDKILKPDPDPTCKDRERLSGIHAKKNNVGPKRFDARLIFSWILAGCRISGQSLAGSDRAYLKSSSGQSSHV